MKIAAVTTFKQGDLFNAMKQAGWSAAELSRKSGVSYQAILYYLSMTRRPSPESIKKMSDAFENNGTFFDAVNAFPENFGILKKKAVIEQVKDFDCNALEGLIPMEHNLLEDIQKREELELINKEIDKLKNREKVALIGYINGKKAKEIAVDIGCKGERARQIVNYTIRKIRHRLNNENKLYRVDLD